LGGGEADLHIIWGSDRPPWLRTQEIVSTFLLGMQAIGKKTYIIQKVRETLRRHTTVAINKHTAKEPISLIMEMLSYY
jgi:hypothetical protein